MYIRIRIRTPRKSRETYLVKHARLRRRPAASHNYGLSPYEELATGQDRSRGYKSHDPFAAARHFRHACSIVPQVSNCDWYAKMIGGYYSLEAKLNRTDKNQTAGPDRRRVPKHEPGFFRIVIGVQDDW